MTVTLSFSLTPDEVEVVTRPIVGDGGHQRLLRLLVEDRLTMAGRMTLSLPEFEAVKRHATNYGEGGYQQRFRTLVAAAARVGLE